MKKYKILNEINHNSDEYDNIALDDNDVKKYKELVLKKIGENSSIEENLENIDEHINLNKYNPINKNHEYKNKKKNTLKNKAIPIIAASIAFVLIISITPIGATVKQSFETMSIKISEIFGMNDDIQEYSNVVGQSISNKDVKITLGEVIIEEGTLDVLYEYEYLNKNKSKEDNLVDMLIYKNGKLISTGSSGFEENKGKFNITYLDVTIDDVVKRGDILEFVFGEGKKNMEEIGKISFRVDNDNLKNKTKSIDINKKIQLDSKNYIELDRFTYNDFSKRLYIKGSNNLIDNYQFFVIAKNEAGEEVEVELREYGDGVGRLQANPENNNFFKNNKNFTLNLYVKKGGMESGEFKSSDYHKTGESIEVNLN